MGLVKHTCIGVGAATLLIAGVVAWTPLSSYIRTGLRTAGEAAADAVPTAFEIENIKTRVDDLDSIIRDNQAKLVKQRVDLKYLQGEVDRSQTRVEELTKEVNAARKILSIHQASYTIGDGNFDRSTVEKEARHKAEMLIRAREIAKAKQTTLDALAGALQQAEQQIGLAKKQREQSRLRLVELEAKAENVAIRQELAVTLDKLPDGIDTGAFQEVEEAFARVEKDLEVQDRMLDEVYTSAPRASQISFSSESNEDILAMLDRSLQQPAKQQAPAEQVLPAADENRSTADRSPQFVTQHIDLD